MIKNLLTLPSAKWRYIAYVAYAVGSLVITDLATRGLVTTHELEGWTALGALFHFTAAANVAMPAPVATTPPKTEAGAVDLPYGLTIVLVVLILVLLGVIHVG